MGEMGNQPPNEKHMQLLLDYYYGFRCFIIDIQFLLRRYDRYSVKNEMGRDGWGVPHKWYHWLVKGKAIEKK